MNRFLHFCDNENPPRENKKFHKIRPVFEYITNKFCTVYIPNRDISIDESLLLWKGRLSFKQYIRIKKARFGIKTYILSEAKSGYIWKVIVYVGQETEIQQNPKVGHATNVIMTIMENLLDKGYCVYSDNYYCSPELALSLHHRKTDLTGTVKSNRKGLPKKQVKEKLEKSEAIVASEEKNRMIYLKWRDKRDVHLLSTHHTFGYKQVMRKGKEVMVPNLVHDYNLNMGGGRQS